MVRGGGWWVMGGATQSNRAADNTRKLRRAGIHELLSLAFPCFLGLLADDCDLACQE
jgi:hypothetical protein